MNTLPKIAYTVVIADTGETTQGVFQDVEVLMKNIINAKEGAELVFGGQLDVSTNVDEDDIMHLRMTWPTGKVYMTVTAMKVEADKVVH
jgi:hypothetical protein